MKIKMHLMLSIILITVFYVYAVNKCSADSDATVKQNAQQTVKNEKEIIKEFIEKAFVKGFLFGDLEEVKNGFHPGFSRLVFENDMIYKVPIYNDMEMERRRQIREPGFCF